MRTKGAGTSRQFGPTAVPAIYRVLARVTQDADTCWLWDGKTNHGYGRIALTGRERGRETATHRVTFEHFVGAIPERMTLDHICHDPDLCRGGPSCKHRRCVNPDHLRLATIKENVLRSNGLTALASRATHCHRGHEFTPENTYRSKRQRHCRECGRENLRRWRAEHNEQYLAQRRAYRAERRAAGKAA